MDREVGNMKDNPDDRAGKKLPKLWDLPPAPDSALFGVGVFAGKRYEVSMKGEKEFGGPMLVTKVTPTEIEAVFSFPDWTDTDVLTFAVRDGKIFWTDRHAMVDTKKPVNFKLKGVK
jgi:hypothetical protein